MSLMINNLQHWGIMGMRWGRRTGGDTVSKGTTGHAPAKVMSADAEAVASLKGKKLHEMSNDEVRKIVTRMQLEQQYNQLNPATKARGKISVEKIIKTMTTINSAIEQSNKIYATMEPFMSEKTKAKMGMFFGKKK